ncbi:MAG: hypothetical protein JXA57_17260 [Armatimonadetes bacterium]|nr:hypothetical protein [Armatimonadota bacterium]
MPLLVIIDPLALSRGYMGSAERYFQVANALGQLGWDTSVISRRDSSSSTRRVDADFPGQILRTPFGTLPALLNRRGLRYAWWLANRWSRRAAGEDIWASRLTRWSGRCEPGSPLRAASLLCAVSYHHWGVVMAVRTLAAELGIPYWIDIQDPLRGTIDGNEHALSEGQLRALADARQIVTTTATYTEHLREVLPQHADRIECLRLTHNPTASLDAGGAPQNGRLVLLHAGYLNGEPNRSAIPVLKAVARLYQESPSARGKVVLRLMGEGHGMGEAVAEAKRLGLRQDLDCRPPVHPELLQQYLNSADVLCILKAATIRRDYQIPGKTYHYMFSNKPILAVTYPGELATIVEESGAGFAVDASDTERLSSLLRQWLAQKEALGTVVLERDANRLSPYSFAAFRDQLEMIVAECIKTTARDVES